MFWPLSQFLLETIGWRLTFAVYAALHLVVCLPIHLFALPAGRPAHRTHRRPTPRRRVPQRGPAFVWLATALSLAAFIGFGRSPRIHRAC